MLDTLKEMLTSKKLIATVVSGVAWAVAKIGWDADMTTLLPIIGPLWLYIVGQALADHGKEAAKIDAAATLKALDATAPTVQS